MFNRKNQKKQPFVVLDISSASVGVMISRRQDDGRLEILFSERTPVNFLMDVNFEAFWRCAKDSLQKVLAKAAKSGFRPKSCFCIFSAPWYISQTKIVTVKKDTPFKITKSFLDKLLADEEKEYMTAYATRIGADKSRPSIIVDHVFIKTEVNGYLTQSPVEKVGKNFRAHIYVSLGIEEVKKEIENEILKDFGDIPLLFSTFPLTAFNVLSGLVNVGDGLIFIDIGGEITELTFMKKYCVEETVSFPVGKNLALRKVAEKMNSSPQEAESVLKIYSRGHAADKEKQLVAEAIAVARKEWCRLFGQALQEMEKTKALPRHFFAIGDEITETDFMKCDGAVCTAYKESCNPVKIESMLPGGLAHYFVFPDGTDQDIVLMIDAMRADNVLSRIK